MLGASIISGGASAVSQSAMARQNAAFARYEAAQIKEIGAYNEMKGRDRMSRLIGQQRAQLAARGVQGNVGSALDLGDEAAAQNFMEAQATRFNTNVRAQSKSNEAAISDYQATTGLWNGMLGTGARALGQALDLWPQLAGA